jgi:heme oxygenase
VGGLYPVILFGHAPFGLYHRAVDDRRSRQRALTQHQEVDVVMDGRYEDVARRAYDLFLARGGQHGHDVDDWLEAERQLLTVTLPPRAARTASVVRAATAAAKPRKRSRV